MILNWLSVSIDACWTFPLISCTKLAFIETVLLFFHLNNTVTVGDVISFSLLSPTMPVLWLPVSIRTLVISDFDWPGPTASINVVCIITCPPAANIDCPFPQSSTKGGTVLAVKTLLDGGFLCLITPFFNFTFCHYMSWVKTYVVSSFDFFFSFLQCWNIHYSSAVVRNTNNLLLVFDISQATLKFPSSSEFVGGLVFSNLLCRDISFQTVL